MQEPSRKRPYKAESRNDATSCFGLNESRMTQKVTLKFNFYKLIRGYLRKISTLFNIIIILSLRYI